MSPAALVRSSALAVACLVLPANPALSAAVASQSPFQSSPPPGTTIEIYRPSRFMCSGSGDNIPVIIDDKEVGRIQSGRFFMVRVTPGTHAVRGDETPPVQVEVKTDQVAFVRFRYDHIGSNCQHDGIGLAVMAHDEAQRELAGLKPSDAKYIYANEVASAPVAAPPAPVHSDSRAPQNSAPANQRAASREPSIYDTAAPFNVLDKVYQDQKTGQVTLFGHVDNRYDGPPIPYLLHLGVLVANPRPEFTLDWTPDTQRSLAAFLRRLDSEDERRRAVDEWTNFYDSQHRITEVGRQMLSSMGVSPTRNGGAPGYLGLELADGTPNKSVTIRSVDRGSPAEHAGIQAGQSIISAMFVEPRETFQSAHSAPGLWAGVVGHSVLEAGEGATAIICVQGRENCYSVVLGAARVDPWADMSTQDVTEALFRAAGMRRAAAAIEALALFQRTPGATMAAVSAMWNVLGIGDDERDELSNRVRSGALSNQQAVGVIFRRICREFDDRLETGGKLVAAYDQTLARGGSTVEGGNACFDRIPQAAQPLQRKAIDQLLGRPGGFRIDPQLIQRTFGVRPEVAPRFIGVDPHSSLARVMEDADVLGKSLIDRPELVRKFPAYQTWYQYGEAHGLLREGTYHMWISPGKINAAESSNGSTLEIRSFPMRMNVREVDAAGHDIPQSQSGYEELLSSLYDPLSLEYPVLHELSEAAKLSLAAEWLRARQPGLKFPEARGNWSTQERLPGYLYVYLRAIGTSDRFDTTIIPAGGVALSPFPPGNSDVKLADAIAQDASVVDLRDTESGKAVIDPGQHAVILPGLRVEVWTGQGNTGGKAFAGISVRLNAEELSATASDAGYAAGRPYVDCAATPALLKRLGQGLSVEREAIRREEALLAQIDGSGPNSGQRQNETEMARDTIDGLKNFATDFLLDWSPVDKALDSHGVDLATRQKLESRYESIRASAEGVANNLANLRRPGAEGYKYGTDIQKDAFTLQALAQRVSSFLDDSGLSDEAGKDLMQQLAKQLIARGAIEEWSMAMPLAGLTFTGSKLVIDASAVAYQWHFEKANREIVVKNLDAMRTAYDQLDQRMTNLSVLMAENCVSVSHQ